MSRPARQRPCNKQGLRSFAPSSSFAVTKEITSAMATEQVVLNPVNIVEFALCYFRNKGVSSKGRVNEKEREMGQCIIELIENNSTGVEHYEESTLVVCEGSDCESSDSDSDTDCQKHTSTTGDDMGKCLLESDSESPETSDSKSQSPCKSSGSVYYPSPVKNTNEDVSISYEYKKKAVEFWLIEGGKKRFSISHVRRNFRRVMSERQLYLWKKQVESMTANPSEHKKNYV